ncbi:N-acetylneuraminate synthase family protein [Nitrosopumilus ureiphilus]|uniref:N-acetylneuraminate synthase n=1 Tax=Nitrosopumilus ureiphilus TaxID=1470067 RepID=A0A7D5RA76_9ARCH|nr:N-acetylneuraminate synthase family protein [Nitrosopumilus ureiphilus]QLH05802.1 N-acetylneuraminate synthase [Nitrosopumilus ureiphilus]
MVFITAEIGINHNGNLSIAKQLIDIAKQCGCDAVKFQKRTVEKVYSKETLDAPRESPWGTTTREQKYGLEFGKDEYDEIDKYCFLNDIEWYASSWDVDSQKFLRQYDLKHNKVASAMLTNHELLHVIAEEKKDTFISTGMSTIDEIESAVKIFQKYDCPFELQHSNSSYPMKIEEANLKCIETLKQKFNCNVGYSGHEDSAYLVCLVATTLGATSIERHITLSRSMYGSDQSASLELAGLKRMVRDVRSVDKILGDGVKKVWDSEVSAMKKLRVYS